jgi:hypothetical protein
MLVWSYVAVHLDSSILYVVILNDMFMFQLQETVCIDLRLILTTFISMIFFFKLLKDITYALTYALTYAISWYSV